MTPSKPPGMHAVGLVMMERKSGEDAARAAHPLS